MQKLIATLFLCCCALTALGQIQANEIRIARGIENYPPYEMRVNGQLTGLHVEVIEAVAARIGHKIVWDELPWARAQRCAENGHCDAISYISPSPAREKWGLFLPGNVLSQVDMRFMTLKSNKDKIIFNGNVSDFLADKVLLSVIGYNYGPDVAKAKKYEVKDLAVLVAMVAARRYELAIINADDFAGLKSNGDLMLLDPPVWVSQSFIAFSRKANNAADLSARFEAAYVDFKKTKDYASIVKRYKTAAQ